MDISKKVCALLNSLKCQGKSQNEIANEIGIASSVLTKIKQGKSTDPSAGTIYAIAKYFEVSADWLLGLPTSNKTKITKGTLDRKIFSKRLKELREENNMSCAALATRIGVTGASLGYCERGERVPDIETTQKICCVLGVTSDYLIGLSDVPTYDYDIEICVNMLHSEREKTADFIEKYAKEMIRMSEKLRGSVNNNE